MDPVGKTNKLSFHPSCRDEHQKGFWRNSKAPKKQLPTAEGLRKKSGLVYTYHLETHTIHAWYIYHPFG